MVLSGLLIFLLVTVVVLGVVFYIINKMTIEPGLRNLIYLVVLLFVVITFLSYLGLF